MTEKNRIYNAVDFERYHSGSMPGNEMHELEKAALEDPFLADALEGYTYTTSFENDIAALKEAMDEKRNKKKAFSISSFAHGRWWRIAALFIIITGSGYFFYKLKYNKENALAKNDIKSFKLNKDSSLKQFDTNKTTNNIALEKHALSADSFAAASEKDYAYTEKNKVAANGNYKNNKANYLLKGKVTNVKGKSLAFASVKDNINDKATVTDSTGKSLLHSPDSNATATISAMGYATKNVRLQKDSQAAIAMNKNQANLDEADVNSTYKNKALKEPSFINKSAAPVLSNNEKFDQYLTKNTQPVYDENNKQLTGEVVLSFSINKKGKPVNIKVVQSSCKDCQTEAIQLLQNGPQWAGQKHTVKKVLIRF